jgi:hypothetical protein
MLKVTPFYSYAECRSADCRCAECRGAIHKTSYDYLTIKITFGAR